MGGCGPRRRRRTGRPNRAPAPGPSGATGIYTSGGPRENGSVHTYRESRTAAARRELAAARASVASAPLLDLRQGDMVRHAAFGKGMVLSVRPMGGDALVEVASDNMGTKKLMLKSAGKHMEKL